MDISIIIVNYNSGEFLYNCIKSIQESIIGIEYEIIIIDNYSTDKSLEICKNLLNRNIQIIKLEENLGFSKANNIGIKYSKGTVLHFLNPDTRIDSEMNKDYTYILKEVKSGQEKIYSNKLLNRDGSYTYKIIMPLPLSKIRDKIKKTNEHDYFYSGATIIISKQLMETLGGWNEAMFMYCEDTDLSYKAHQKGIKIQSMPAIIYHYGGGSSERSLTNISHEIIMHKSLRAFYRVNNICILQYWLAIMIFCMELIIYKRAKKLPLYIKGIIKSF